MEYDIAGLVISFVLGISTIAPFLLRARSILREVFDLLGILKKDLEDDQLTADEIKEIVDEARQLIKAIKGK